MWIRMGKFSAIEPLFNFYGRKVVFLFLAKEWGYV